jgi:hypothetical protein
MIEALGSIFILAVLIEAIVEYFVVGALGERTYLIRYVAALIGIILCLVYNADLFRAAGILSTVPFVGNVLTGLIVSRGSNYLNDFISKIRVMAKKED